MNCFWFDGKRWINIEILSYFLTFSGLLIKIRQNWKAHKQWFWKVPTNLTPVSVIITFRSLLAYHRPNTAKRRSLPLILAHQESRVLCVCECVCVDQWELRDSTLNFYLTNGEDDATECCHALWCRCSVGAGAVFSFLFLLCVLCPLPWAAPWGCTVCVCVCVCVCVWVSWGGMLNYGWRWRGNEG